MYIYIFVYKSNSNTVVISIFYSIFSGNSEKVSSAPDLAMSIHHHLVPLLGIKAVFCGATSKKTLVPKAVALCFEFHMENEVCSIDSFKNSTCIVVSCFFLGKMMDWFEVLPQFWDKPLYLLLVWGGPIHLLINQPMGRGHPVSQRRNSASIPWGSKGYPGDVAEHWRHVESRK